MWKRIRISVVVTWTTSKFSLSVMTRAETVMFTLFFQVALLDYGQVKDLPDQLRLGYAKLVLGIADGDSTGVADSFR